MPNWLTETCEHVSTYWKVYVPTVLAIGGVIQSVYHCFPPQFCEAAIGIAAALGIYSTGHKTPPS